jgi:hypothetical protein
MIYRFITILVFFILSYGLSYCQYDTIPENLIEYSADFKFIDGIYITKEQMINNSPVPKTLIISSYDSKNFDFFDNLVSENQISYYNELGIETKIKTANIWGYCNNGAIYIQHNDRFNRIGIIGNICHFVALETVYNNTYPYSYGYDPYGYNYPVTSSVEMRQYLLKFDTGQIFDYTTNSVEILLMNDTELYEEFINLKKRQRKKLVFVYVRKFNERNPLYLPNNL